jgi:hypothetical protein
MEAYGQRLSGVAVASIVLRRTRFRNGGVVFKALPYGRSSRARDVGGFGRWRCQPITAETRKPTEFLSGTAEFFVVHASRVPPVQAGSLHYNCPVPSAGALSKLRSRQKRSIFKNDDVSGGTFPWSANAVL